jgi:hypothetical protein
VGKVLCGWHKMYYPDESVPVLGKFPAEGDSHGMCERCAARYTGEARQASDRYRFDARRCHYCGSRWHLTTGFLAGTGAVWKCEDCRERYLEEKRENGRES